MRARVTPRRFPPPWTVEEGPACFIVRDSAGQKLAYVHFEDEPGRRSAAKLLTGDEARRIAVNFAKLPDLVRRPAILAQKSRFCVSLGKTEERTMQISECQQQARQCRKMAAEMNDPIHKKQMEVMAEIWETLVLELSKLNR